MAFGLTVDDGSGLRQVFGADLDLSILQSNLRGESDREAHDDLKSDPFPCACCFVHGVEQPAANSSERAAYEPEHGNDADFGESETLRDGCECKRDDQCQHADAGADWVRIVDALGVDWEVVEDDEV